MDDKVNFIELEDFGIIQIDEKFGITSITFPNTLTYEQLSQLLKEKGDDKYE